MLILIAESDPALATFLERGFNADHYAVDVTEDAGQAAKMALAHRYDAAILDLTVAQPDGLDVLRQIRAGSADLPILILANQTRPEERAQVLDAGADDVVLKPFAFSELSARVRALLRRGGRTVEMVLRVDDLELNRVEHCVKRAQKKIELTPKEFALLEYLMRNSGRRVTRAEIIENVWNLNFDTMTNVVDVYINYASAQIDKRKVGQLAMAIQVAFQKMGVFDASNTKPEVLQTEPMPFSKVQMVENAQRVEKLDELVSSPHGDPTEDARRAMDQIQNQLQDTLRPELQNRTVSVTATKEGIVVSLREAGFFASGSASLRPEAKNTLADFVKVIGPYPVRIRIEGHTDNVPIHNSRFDSNWDLSTARATEIIKLFISQYGIAPDRLSAAGYGEYYPVASNDTPSGRAMNRRVDLVILAPNSETGPPLPPDSNALSGVGKALQQSGVTPNAPPAR
jgi:two-component system, OmpR family, copper resistance phosphate regulon response regulator CusR